MMGAGTKAQARVELANATRALIKALDILKDVQSEESRAILKALDSLAKVTPDVDEGVSQSEVKAMMAGAETAKPGPGAMPGGMMGGGAGMGLGPGAPRPFAAAGMPFNPAMGAGG